MSDAPERIWIGRDERYVGRPWDKLVSQFCGDDGDETAEYIRFDLHDAALKAVMAERDRFEAALARTCLAGVTTHLVERAEAAEAIAEASALRARVAGVWGDVEPLLAAAEAQLAYMDLCNDRGDLERNLRTEVAALRAKAKEAEE